MSWWWLGAVQRYLLYIVTQGLGLVNPGRCLLGWKCSIITFVQPYAWHPTPHHHDEWVGAVEESEVE